MKRGKKGKAIILLQNLKFINTERLLSAMCSTRQSQPKNRKQRGLFFKASEAGSHRRSTKKSYSEKTSGSESGIELAKFKYLTG